MTDWLRALHESFALDHLEHQVRELLASSDPALLGRTLKGPHHHEYGLEKSDLIDADPEEQQILVGWPKRADLAHH